MPARSASWPVECLCSALARSMAVPAAVVVLVAACATPATSPAGASSAAGASPAPATEGPRASDRSPAVTAWAETTLPGSPAVAASTGPPSAAAPAPTRPLGSADAWTEIGRQGSDHWTLRGTVPFPDGRVLVAGYRPSDGREVALLFDPWSGSWDDPGIEVDPGDALVPQGDGTILQAGVTEPRLWRSEAGHWSFYGSNIAARGAIAPSVVALADGRVLAAGGCRTTDQSSGSAGAQALDAVDVYDLDPGWEWDADTRTGPLTVGRMGAPAVLLSDGRVLVAGSLSGPMSAEARSDGAPAAPCTTDPQAAWTSETWDPGSGRFTAAGAIPPPDPDDFAAKGIEIPSERPAVEDAGRLVALAGGGALLLDRRERWPLRSPITRFLRYDAALDRWSEIAQPHASEDWGWSIRGVDRRYAAVVALADGRVLVAGGLVRHTGDTEGRVVRWVDAYDPATDGWTPLPALPAALDSAAGARLPDGTILLVGVGHAAGSGVDVVALALKP